MNRLKELIVRNWPLKVFAIALAVVIWLLARIWGSK